MVKTSVKVSRNQEITTEVRQVSLQPFTRKKKIIQGEKKNEIKRKEFYDSTVRTEDYMRKSGMNLPIVLQILLKKLCSKNNSKLRGMKCVMMSMSENFLLRGKDKKLSN